MQCALPPTQVSLQVCGILLPVEIDSNNKKEKLPFLLKKANQETLAVDQKPKPSPMPSVSPVNEAQGNRTKLRAIAGDTGRKGHGRRNVGD